MSSPRPSNTAKKIARFMILLDSIPRLRGLLPPGAADMVERLLHASGAVRPGEISMMRRPWVRRFMGVVERLTTRGQVLWFGMRKRYMADAVDAAIADGATQLLVVGAGFDPLAALIARRHPHVLCVEIDAPATAEPKRVGLQGAGAARDNLHVLAVDVAERSIADALRLTPWRCDLRSVVVAEGLLMYLDIEHVRAFFTTVRAVTGPGSRVVFSCVDGGGADGSEPRLMVPMDRLIRFTLRLAGETMRWGVRPPALPDFLAALGFRLLEQPDLETLRRRYLAPLDVPDEPLQPYDYLALAEVAPSGS